MFDADELLQILDGPEFSGDDLTSHELVELDHKLKRDYQLKRNQPTRDHLSGTERAVRARLDKVISGERKLGDPTPDITPSVTHLHFDWATTTQGLKAFNPSIKIAYKAKFLFACAISSFADEIMEYLLREKCCTHIQTSDIYDAFAHFNEPLGSFQLIHAKHLSLRRLMMKYRNLYKFEIAADAKRVFACLMTSLMINIATSIHIHRTHTRKTIQIDEVQNITDPIVFIRDYSKKYTMSRSIQASRRVRKSDGKF